MRNVAFHDILYLWLYNRLVDRELSKNFLVDPSQRQVGHPCYRSWIFIPRIQNYKNWAHNCYNWSLKIHQLVLVQQKEITLRKSVDSLCMKTASCSRCLIRCIGLIIVCVSKFLYASRKHFTFDCPFRFFSWYRNELGAWCWAVTHHCFQFSLVHFWCLWVAVIIASFEKYC